MHHGRKSEGSVRCCGAVITRHFFSLHLLNKINVSDELRDIYQSSRYIIVVVVVVVENVCVWWI